MNKEYLFKWIQNAYAMEKEIEVILDRQEKDAENIPELASLIREHKEQTASQGERLKDILEAHEEDIPTVRENIGKAMGFLKGESTELMKDQLIRNYIALHTTEHFEMATYKVILQACDDLSEPDIKTLIEDILHEEEEAVRKIDMMMPTLVSAFIQATQDED